MGAALALLPAPAGAAGFTVTSNLDQVDASPGNGVCATAGNVCTLRAAVMEANAVAGADVITVPDMTITLGQELVISSNMEIRGAGARRTILTATSGHRSIVITGGTTRLADFAIQDITTTAGYGTAIHQENGNSTLARLRIANITATSTTASSGPVLAANGTMSITDSEISGNSVTGSLLNVYGAAVGTGNSGTSATVSIVNSTIVGNSASTGGSQFALGGVYAGPNNTVEIESSTIAGNSVANGSYGRGGGVYHQSGGTGSFLIKDSILAGGSDTASIGGNCYPAGSGSRAITFAGRNVIDDATCGAASAQVTIGDAMLRSLGNYGGPTNTRPPAAGSPAVDAASGCVSSADQRGQSRPIGGACDVGPVESGADLGVGVALSNTSPKPGGDFVATVQVANAGLDTATGTTAAVTVSGAQILAVTPQAGSCDIAGASVSCALPETAAGGATSVLISARAPLAGESVVQAQANAQQPDPVPGNNAAVARAGVVAVPGSEPTGGSATTPGACVNVITGNATGNTLAGTSGGDRISGRGGADRITGLAGVDCLSGGGGNDRLTPGTAADRVSAGPGRDTVKAKDGARDRITCGGGRDTVYADRKDKVGKDCESVRR